MQVFLSCLMQNDWLDRQIEKMNAKEKDGQNGLIVWRMLVLMDGDATILCDVIICSILISSTESDQEQDTQWMKCDEWVMMLWGRIWEAFVICLSSPPNKPTNGFEVVECFNPSKALAIWWATLSQNLTDQVKTGRLLKILPQKAANLFFLCLFR